LRIYRKEADIIQILSFPDEIVEKADYLLVRDMKLKRALLAQVIDIQFANIPGILEDLLRDVMTDESLEGQDYDPLDVSSQISILKDTRLLICKVRGTMEGGHLPQGSHGFHPAQTLGSRFST